MTIEELQAIADGNEYVGVAYDGGGWGGDLTGLLLHREETGWAVAASHISSSESWARVDIGGHAERLGVDMAWVGVADVRSLLEAFPPADELDDPMNLTSADRGHNDR